MRSSGVNERPGDNECQQEVEKKNNQIKHFEACDETGNRNAMADSNKDTERNEPLFHSGSRITW